MLDIQNFSTLVSLLALVITWLIIQPLKQSINGLQRAVERLTELVDDTKAEVKEIRERLVVCEQSCKSAHRRLDECMNRHDRE